MNDHPEDTPSDIELIARANRGVHGAFDSLYRRHRDWALTLAFRFCGSRDDSFDITQEAFLWLMRRFPGFDLRVDSLRAVLYPIVRSIALARRRREQTRDAHAPFVARSRPGLSDSELTEIERQEHQESILLALESLSDDHREVMLMRFADGLSLDEIAAALTIPVGTVKSRLHHALRAVRKES